jgi:hypothetical protein
MLLASGEGPRIRLATLPDDVAPGAVVK